MNGLVVIQQSEKGSDGFRKEWYKYRAFLANRSHKITGWAVAQTCCISQWPKYRKRGIFDHPWEQNP